jgi:tetratricopeptide (TPR) repeat protein
MSAKVSSALLVALAFAMPLPPAGVAAAAPAPATAAPASTGVLAEPARELGPGRWARELARREAILAGRRGRDPAAVLALAGLLPELQGELPPGTLERFVDEVAGDRGRHPLVRSYAGMLRAQLYEEQGRLADAQARLLAEGYLVRWQIVGPFDNAGRKGETEAHAPQTEPFSAAQIMLGKLPGEPLSWRHYDYEGIPRGGYVSFDDLLRPNEEVTGYATSWVHVDAATDAVLHVGTGGPYRAWVGTTEVGHGDAYRTPHPLQDAHPVKLAAGWNRLLVKTSAQSGMWGFYARLSLRSGAPIDALQSTAEPPEGAPVVAPGTSGGGSPTTEVDALSLRGLLEKRYPGRDSAVARPGPAAAGLQLVELYRWIHPFDSDDRSVVELATRVDERVKSSRSAWLRTLVDRDQNTSRVALDEAVTRARAEGPRSAPLLGQLLLEVAWRERTLGLERQYRTFVDEAHAVAPDDPLVALALADRLADDGFPWLAVDTLRTLIERFPTSSTLRHDLAARLRGQGRTEEALATLAALARDRGTSEGLSAARIEALLELGRADEAAKVARTSADSTPGVPDVHARLAEVELARGDIDAARAALGQAIALAPQAADLHASMGSLLLRSGAQAAAVAAFERSLQLRPQQPELRDLLASLHDDHADDLLARYGVELEKLGGLPTPASWKGKDAGVLHHRVVVRVLPNGLTERLDHRIVRVLDDRGIGSQAVQGMVFDPAESMVEVRRARVRRKDGTIEALGDTQVFALASAGYRMYYDQRQIVVQFPGLRVGDTLEVAFLRRDVAARNMFDEYFGDLMPLQSGEPMRHVEYVLEAPSDKPLYFNRKVKKTESADGKTTTYRVVADDVPGIKPEGAMPGWTEVAQYLHVSTYRSWDDVGRWYWNLVREQLVVDDSIRKGVAQVLAKLPADADARAKVFALYEHVVRNTRYVGLEFGIHGFKPYRTTDIYSRRFGDCKDKASLLKVMLAEAGIDSNLVLVRTRDQGSLPADPASLAAFNHAITYVPSLDLFLDGTAEWSGPGELPSNDQGATVLVIEDGAGAELRTIPMSAAADNGRRTEQRVALKADGTAAVEHTVTVWGGGASSVRYRFQSPEERQERLTAAFGDVFPGVEVRDVKAPGLDEILRPATLSATLKVPRWATQEGQALRFQVLGRESRLTTTMAGTAEREHDLVLDLPSTEENEIRYTLPSGHKLTRLPAGKTLDTPVGKFSLEVEPRDDGVAVRSRLQLTRARITPAEYDAFRQFLRQVDASLEQSFEVTPER